MLLSFSLNCPPSSYCLPFSPRRNYATSGTSCSQSSQEQQRVFTGVFVSTGLRCFIAGSGYRCSFSSGDAALALGQLSWLYMLLLVRAIVCMYIYFNAPFVVRNAIFSLVYHTTVIESCIHRAIGPAGLSGDLPYGLDTFRILSPIRPCCEVITFAHVGFHDLHV